MGDYISYKKIPEIIELKKGDKVYLSSDIMMLGYLAMMNKEPFSMNALLECFQEAVGKEGTLLIPTFCFDFSNTGVYDYRSTKIGTGALGKAALERNDFRRTKHPMHSFAVWGADQEKLCSMDNINSFGMDSPFAYMRDEHVIQVMLGTDYTDSFTFAHFCETNANVPYRFNKEFVGNYIDSDGMSTKKRVEYPARHLEYEPVEQFNRVGAILEEKGISKEYDVNGVKIRVMNLHDCYDTVYDDAKNNKAANLYDFNMDPWKGLS